MFRRSRSAKPKEVPLKKKERKYQEPEDAYDAAQYFIDDVRDPWQEGGFVFKLHKIGKPCFF